MFGVINMHKLVKLNCDKVRTTALEYKLYFRHNTHADVTYINVIQPILFVVSPPYN